MRTILLAILGVTLALPAYAQERSAIGQWFDSLKLPAPIAQFQAGASCCSKADCRQREIRYGLTGMEAWIEEVQEWRVIPPQVWITDAAVLESRPFWQTIVCFVNSAGIVCAVRGRIGG